MTAKALLETEHRENIEKNFDIVLTEIVGEDIRAVFTDIETGEVYNVNTTEVSAAALPLVPILIRFVVKYGLKKAVKSFGKKAINRSIKKTESVARVAAKALGYIETNFKSHGAKVYKRGKKAKGPRYISRDVDKHSGGSWKGAKTIKALGKKETRSGTYDALLRRIGD